MNLDFAGIDTGRHMTDAAGEQGVTSIPSKVGSGRPLRDGKTLDYNVVLDGEHFFVGSLANESHDRRRMTSESKLHQETKVLFLTALALVTEGRPANITALLPVKQHKPETKLLYRALVAGKHRIGINGGPEINLSIDDLQFVKEGHAAWWNTVLDDQGKIRDQALLRQPVTRVIDLGSRMINYVTLIEGVYLDRASDSLEYGCMELELPGNDPEQLAKRIWGDLTNVWTDMRKTDLLFLTGRGVQVMGDILAREFYSCVVAEDPGTANAKGARKLGMVYAHAAV